MTLQEVFFIFLKIFRLDKMGIKLIIKDIPYKGTYETHIKTITLNPKYGFENNVITLWHELVHAEQYLIYKLTPKKLNILTQEEKDIWCKINKKEEVMEYYTNPKEIEAVLRANCLYNGFEAFQSSNKNWREIFKQSLYALDHNKMDRMINLSDVKIYSIKNNKLFIQYIKKIKDSKTYPRE